MWSTEAEAEPQRTHSPLLYGPLWLGKERTSLYSWCDAIMLMLSGEWIVPFGRHTRPMSRHRRLRWLHQLLPYQTRSSPKRFTKSYWRLASTCCYVTPTSTAQVSLNGLLLLYSASLFFSQMILHPEIHGSVDLGALESSYNNDGLFDLAARAGLDTQSTYILHIEPK